MCAEIPMFLMLRSLTILKAYLYSFTWPERPKSARRASSFIPPYQDGDYSLPDNSLRYLRGFNTSRCIDREPSSASPRIDVRLFDVHPRYVRTVSR